MRLPDFVDRAYHHPQDVMVVLTNLQREAKRRLIEPTQRQVLLTPTLARGLIIAGSVLTLGAGVIWAGPLVNDFVKDGIKADNEVVRRENQMYNPAVGLDSKGDSSSEPVEKSLTTRALEEYLRPRVGENFQVVEAPEPLVAQSIALGPGNKPLGHWYYDLPVRDLSERTLTNGPADGPTYDSIQYGKKAPISDWVLIPGASGHSSVWAVTRYVDSVTGQLRYKFANDFDGNDPSGRWSISYTTRTVRRPMLFTDIGLASDTAKSFQ